MEGGTWPKERSDFGGIPNRDLLVVMSLTHVSSSVANTFTFWVCLGIKCSSSYYVKLSRIVSCNDSKWRRCARSGLIRREQ